jgi:hypothetical protein
MSGHPFAAEVRRALPKTDRQVVVTLKLVRLSTFANNRWIQHSAIVVPDPTRTVAVVLTSLVSYFIEGTGLHHLSHNLGGEDSRGRGRGGRGARGGRGGGSRDDRHSKTGIAYVIISLTCHSILSSLASTRSKLVMDGVPKLEALNGMMRRPEKPLPRPTKRTLKERPFQPMENPALLPNPRSPK